MICWRRVLIRLALARPKFRLNSLLEVLPLPQQLLMPRRSFDFELRRSGRWDFRLVWRRRAFDEFFHRRLGVQLRHRMNLPIKLRRHQYICLSLR